MRGRVHDVVWGTVRVVLAVVLLGAAWQLARSAERDRSADLDFPRLEIHDAQGRDTGSLKVCGDRYREPFCLRAEHVAVDEVLLKLNKKSGARYRFEFGRSGGRTLALKLDVDHADQDLVEAAGRHGKATLYWWRDSVRLLEVSAGGEQRMLRTAHYPGREFVPPAAFGSLLAGLGAAFLWSGLWRIVRGGVSRLNWPWQTTVPGVTFTLAGLGGALGALFAVHSPWTMAWTAGVVGAVSAVGTACWAYRLVRRTLPALERMEPVAPVAERRFLGTVWGPGPWQMLSMGWLRTGPQGLAAVSGPASGTGSFGVRPFPGALRLVGVRPPHRDDPLRLRLGRYRRTDGAEKAQLALVAECEALGGPVPGARVLIGAGSEDLPHVLGALSAATPSPLSPPSVPSAPGQDGQARRGRQ
ncbi:hypothetical protein [Streptomyces sp. NWU339]|uniref:hypothetical protein n=1 Tax=Streptomyces sp. NWU339 TaxID=2185284 RepID=UPI00215A2AAB|nr:hypothetical protein [Streptomyces sp. NWU339]